MKFKIIYILCAILLFIAVSSLPSQYYGFLRIAVTIGALLAIYEEMIKSFNGWVILFVIIALVFNPVMPVYLYNKGLWIPIDVVSGVVFLLFAFQGLLKKKEKKRTYNSGKKTKSYSRDKIY